MKATIIPHMYSYRILYTLEKLDEVCARYEDELCTCVDGHLHYEMSEVIHPRMCNWCKFIHYWCAWQNDPTPSGADIMQTSLWTKSHFYRIPLNGRELIKRRYNVFDTLAVFTIGLVAIPFKLLWDFGKWLFFIEDR